MARARSDDRPQDAGLTSLKGKAESDAVEWWKQRFALIAGIPSDPARVGAIVPQTRELSLLPADERRRLTKARMQAFMALPGDQRQAILAAREHAERLEPELFRSDDAVADELAKEIPGAEEFGRRTFR